MSKSNKQKNMVNTEKVKKISTSKATGQSLNTGAV
jgi:hypothetical protein